MICASEVGTIHVDPAIVTAKGRLQPGKMLLVDTQEGRVVDDGELKMSICSSKPFGEWLNRHLIPMEAIRAKVISGHHQLLTLLLPVIFSLSLSQVPTSILLSHRSFPRARG